MVDFLFLNFYLGYSGYQVCLSPCLARFFNLLTLVLQKGGKVPAQKFSRSKGTRRGGSGDLVTGREGKNQERKCKFFL